MFFKGSQSMICEVEYPTCSEGSPLARAVISVQNFLCESFLLLSIGYLPLRRVEATKKPHEEVNSNKYKFHYIKNI